MKKYQNIILGLAVGFGAFWLFEKVGKKPCDCTGSSNLEGELLESEPSSSDKEMSCEEAVAIVMNDLRKTQRMSEAQFQLRERQELSKCKKMAGATSSPKIVAIK